MQFAVNKQEKRNTVQYKGNPYLRMIEDKLNDELNNYCVECGNEDPEYISINNGVFICVECVQNHLKFPNNISKIIKNDLKCLTLKEIQLLLCGGNQTLLDFIYNEFPKLSQFPPYILYRTQAMVYYRQNLQYMINGGKPPLKPSAKNAYKISNFNQNYNNRNIIKSQNSFNNTISEERGYLNNKNSSENYDKFYQTGFNFEKGRNILNNFNNRFSNTVNNIENNYDNYIINKPRQINFQNNNDFIIGNIDNNYNKVNNNVIGKKIVYSPQRIKVDFKPKNKRTNRSPGIENNAITSYLNTVNDKNQIYIKPKLILSPSVKDKDSKSERRFIPRASSMELIKKDKKIPTKYELLEKGEIIDFQNCIKNNDNNINNMNYVNGLNINWKYKKMNKNLSQRSYIKNNNPLKYIKKNSYIHKSLSQKIIKNDINSFHSIDNSINKKKYVLEKKESNECKQKDITNKNPINISISRNAQVQILSKKNSEKNSINENKNNPINNLKNNEKCSTEETLNFSEAESLPIKINLKISKKEKNVENKKEIIKKDSNKSDKNNKKMPNNNKNKRPNTIESKNIEKKKNTTKKTLHNSHIDKNNSKENIIKKDNNIQKKEIGNDKDEDKITVSIRNKYKLKKKNNQL